MLSMIQIGKLGGKGAAQPVHDQRPETLGHDTDFNNLSISPPLDEAVGPSVTIAQVNKRYGSCTIGSTFMQTTIDETGATTLTGTPTYICNVSISGAEPAPSFSLVNPQTWFSPPIHQVTLAIPVENPADANRTLMGITLGIQQNGGYMTLDLASALHSQFTSSDS
jgi:hypothetical protein